MNAPAFYLERPRPTLNGFIQDDALYSEVVSAFVIDCTDFVAVDPHLRLLYLAERLVHSAQGLWRFGGRRKAGESTQQSCVRLAKRELDLVVAPGRFDYVRAEDCVWAWRQQDPQMAGCHTYIHVFKVEFTYAELNHATKHLDPKEYNPAFGIRGFDREKLLKENARPQLIDLYDAIFPTK